VLAAVKYPGWLVEGDGGIFFLQVGNFHPPLCVSAVSYTHLTLPTSDLV